MIENIDLVEQGSGRAILRYSAPVVPSVGETISIPKWRSRFLVRSVDHCVNIRELSEFRATLSVVTIDVKILKQGSFQFEDDEEGDRHGS